jgi:hypothetical protein
MRHVGTAPLGVPFGPRVVIEGTDDRLFPSRERGRGACAAARADFEVVNLEAICSGVNVN